MNPDSNRTPEGGQGSPSSARPADVARQAFSRTIFWNWCEPHPGGKSPGDAVGPLGLTVGDTTDSEDRHQIATLKFDSGEITVGVATMTPAKPGVDAESYVTMDDVEFVRDLPVHFPALFDEIDRLGAELASSRGRDQSQDWYADVLDFHLKFGAAVGTTPRVPDRSTIALRAALLNEEVRETLAALAAGDLPELADGIVDTVYVALGLLVSYGIDARPVWAAVHQANMAKQLGDGGRVVSEAGKILKPPGWVPADVAGILRQQAPLTSPSSQPVPSGTDLIAAERRRQVSKGYDATHDDGHDDASLLTAAANIIYDVDGGTHTTDPEAEDDPDAEWFDRYAAKVQREHVADPVRRLVIAGSLLAAEVDRRNRAAQP